MNTQPFDVTFNLTVTVTGRSLQDIDDGLVAAAGERLRARMTNPPRLNGKDVLARPEPFNTVVREEPRPGAAAGGDIGPGAAAHDGPADAGGAEAPPGGRKPRGVKPGSTRGPYKKTDAEQAAENTEATQGAAGPQSTPPSAPAAAPPQAAAPVAPQTTAAAPQTGAPVPTLDQCVAALTLVNKAKNTDIAYKCLTDMGVKRCGEIPDARRQEFIDNCSKAAAGA